MRTRAVVLAVALVLAPLGARAADLVVWWGEGFYPEEDAALREVIAAFEQRSGKQVELVLHGLTEFEDKLPVAIEAGRPPDIAWGVAIDSHIPEWAAHDRLVDLTDTVGAFSNLFDPDALAWYGLLNETTKQRALYALPVGSVSNYVHVWKSLLERAGYTLADVPKGWEAFWAFWCDQVQPAVRRATGRDDIWGVGLNMSGKFDTELQVDQFRDAYGADYVTRDGRLVIDDLEVRRKLIKAIDSYAMIYRKGCTPPNSLTWDGRGNNQAFLTQAVVMTVNDTLSIPNALKHEHPKDYYENTATIDMAARSGRPGVSDRRLLPCCSGLQGRWPHHHRQGLRPFPGGRGLARALSRLRGRAHAAADAEAARCAVLARYERPAPHGRGDAGRFPAHAVRLRHGLGRLAL